MRQMKNFVKDAPSDEERDDSLKKTSFSIFWMQSDEVYDTSV